MTRKIRTVIAVVFILSCAFVETSSGQTAQEAPREEAKYLTGPFDPSAGRLPAGFLGHDHQVVVAGLRQRTAWATKGEFETTEQFNRRIQTEKPPAGLIGLDDTIAFVAVPSSLELKYDADRGMMTIKPTPYWRWYKRGLDLGAVIEKDYVTDGTTALGAPVKIRVIYKRYQKVIISNMSDFKTLDWNFGKTAFRIDFALDVEAARQSKDTMGILFIGKLANLEFKSDSYVAGATVNDPIELHASGEEVSLKLQEYWIFDVATGKILKRQGPGK